MNKAALQDVALAEELVHFLLNPTDGPADADALPPEARELLTQAHELLRKARTALLFPAPLVQR